MAVIDRIGHDKRGNITYVRDGEGNEIVEEMAEPGLRTESRDPSPTESRVQRKLIDDDTPEVARAFREWLTDHDL